MANSKAQEEDGSSENEQLDTDKFEKPKLLYSSVEVDDEELPPFLDKQKSKLLQVCDSLLDLMTGVSRDTLRSRVEDNVTPRFSAVVLPGSRSTVPRVIVDCYHLLRRTPL